MKLIYITNTRLPSEKANSYQSMQMCHSFSKIFDTVELWNGKSRNIKEFKKINDIHEFYNIAKTFTIRHFFQFDSYVLGHLNEFIWANLRGLVFSLNVCFHLAKYKKNKNVIFYTRVWHVLFIFILFKKIGLVDNRIFYECHKFSKPLINILKKIDGLIVINEFLSRQYKGLGVSKIFIAHDGVNLSEYANISRYKFKPNKARITILYTGGLFKWKGVETLVDSVNFLPKNFNLICIGGMGKYLDDFKSYVNSSINSDQIKIISHIPRLQILDYVENTDILILPNSSSNKMNLYTSPIKMFEYMASKRPIVASNISSIREVLSKNNSFLFEPDNAKDLALMIQDVASKDCSKIVIQARKDVENYSWDKRAKNIKKYILANNKEF